MSISNNFDFFIQWHLTERCNLACRHCYQSGGNRNEPTLTEIRAVVDEFADMLEAWSKAYGVSFSPAFNLTGGEPLLRSDLDPIVELIGETGASIYILSNGTLIDRGRAQRMAALGVKGVQVSFEGPQDIHDVIRGAGSWLAARSGVENLIDAGIPVTLNVTLSRLNAGRMAEMVSLAAELGAQRLGFSRLVPVGRGLELAEAMLTPDEVRNLYAELLAVDIPGLEIVTGDPVAAQMHAPSPARRGETPLGGCAAGVSGLTLLPDGTILPCRRLEIPLGNIRSDSLREVWATSEVLASLRDQSLYQGRCGACDRWSGCRGCRAIAWAWTRARGGEGCLASDPQCFIGQP
jgi:MoaA/NifB/PqqE/SkfB family radical SAM enzyme